MKKTPTALLAALSAACLLCGCAGADTTSSATTSGESPAGVSAAELIAEIPTTQYFTDEAVSEDDLNTILLAGVNAPSAMNGQPWHFSVITDAAVLEQIAGDMGGGMKPPAGAELPEGFTPPANAPSVPPAGAPAGGGGMSKAGMADAPVAIVISCKEGSALDAGLACQNMSAAACLMGYGTKILSSPTMALNGEKQAEYRTLLGIPEDQSAVAVLLIGREDTSVDTAADGYTGASARNPLADVVTFVQ